MKLVYASRTGNVESIVNQLPYDTQSVNEGPISEPFVLFTYTDGWGEVPSEVESFLEMIDPSLLLGVVVSGDMSYGEAYCLAGEVISNQTGCEVFARIENQGTSEDIDKLLETLASL